MIIEQKLRNVLEDIGFIIFKAEYYEDDGEFHGFRVKKVSTNRKYFVSWSEAFHDVGVEEMSDPPGILSTGPDEWKLKHKIQKLLGIKERT
jgi:hypothetical protein